MRVAVFVTCLADLFRPAVGFASIKLLEDAGCEVDVPAAQTCCGQPAYNNGDLEVARLIGRRAQDLARRTHELTSFLCDMLGVRGVDATFRRRVTYHDSCSSQREMGVREQPRRLLRTVAGLELLEAEGTETCCGFGGTFCVKFPEISGRMVDDKVAAIEATGADTLLAADLGCLLNIAGRLRRRGSRMGVFHVAEVLAGMAEGPGMGEGAK